MTCFDIASSRWKLQLRRRHEKGIHVKPSKASRRSKLESCLSITLNNPATTIVQPLQIKTVHSELAIPGVLSRNGGSDVATRISNGMEHLGSTFTTKTVLKLEGRQVDGTGRPM